MHQVEGTTSIGGRFFLAELENAGGVPLVRPSVVVSGFDADGHRVVEQSGYARRQRLPPGERVVVLALVAEPPAHAVRYELAVSAPNAGGFALEDLPVTVVETTENPGPGHLRHLVGTARNDGTRTARFVHVVAVGRDAAGHAVSYATSYVTARDLAPGASSGFDLTVGSFEHSAPVRWTFEAFGQP